MNKVIEKAISECGNNRLSFAKACDVSVMTVSNWLNGSDIYGSRIKRISDATHGKVSVEEILESLRDK